MKKLLLHIGLPLVGLVLLFCILANVGVYWTAYNHCYDDVDLLPYSDYGLVLCTGRGTDSSAYYDARVQAAIDIVRNRKVGTLIVSGVNQFADYAEVDSMMTDILRAVPNADVLPDYEGVHTYQSVLAFSENFGCDVSCTIISQKFHNQRAVFYGSMLMNTTPRAYNAADPDMPSRAAWLRFREFFARIKAVLVAWVA